jgi:hypothetical protein
MTSNKFALSATLINLHICGIRCKYLELKALQYAAALVCRVTTCQTPRIKFSGPLCARRCPGTCHAWPDTGLMKPNASAGQLITASLPLREF